MQESNRHILQRASHFFSGTMVSRLSGLVRDVLMAAAFGTGASVAAFFVAIRLAHLLRRLLGEGAMASAFVPLFEGVRSRSPQEATQFFRDLVCAVFWFLLLLTAIGMLVLTAVANSSWISPGASDILRLVNIMLPGLPFICLFGLHASLLQCEGRYWLVGVAPVAFNILWILGILCLWTANETVAMPYLSAFIILACLAQWATTWKATKQTVGLTVVSCLWPPQFRSKELYHLSRALSLGVLGVAATQINSALDGVFARIASDSGPAYLWYAIRVQQLPLALFGIALSGALLPPLSRAFHRGDAAGARTFLDYGLRQCMVFLLPMTFFLFAVGGEGLNLVFGHGDFTSESTHETLLCLWGYALGLLPAGWVLLLAPAFYAQKNYKIPSLTVLGSVILNMGLNYFLVCYFGLGATSVAIATSASSWVNFLVLDYLLKKRLPGHAANEMLKAGVKTAVASCLAFGAVITIQSWNGHPSLLDWSFSFPRQLSQQIWQLMQTGLAFIFVYGIAAWWLDIKEYRDLIAPPQVEPFTG